MSTWKMSPQGTTDEAFQAYEAIEELANVTFFSLLICFLFVQQELLLHSKWEKSVLTSYVENVSMFSFAQIFHLCVLYIFHYKL